MLKLEQRDRDLAGNLVVYPPLVGSGPVRGFVDDNRRIRLTVDFALLGFTYRIEFDGFVALDGSMDGSYAVFPTQEVGTWRVTPGC